MDIMSTLKNFFSGLTHKEFIRYTLLFLGLFLTIAAALVYLNQRKISTLETRLRRVNQQRESVKKILQEHAIINQQRATVDSILESDKNFIISQYFENVVKSLGLTAFKSKDPTVQENDLNNGYDEVQLDSGFKNMDMKQVADLLYKIDQSDRVYTKDLVLTKSLKSPKLDITLVIATLQPKITA